MKLRYKFFIAFLTTSLLIITLMVGITQILIYKNFEDFVNRSLLEQLDTLVTSFANEYTPDEKWTAFTKDPELFRKIFYKNIPARFKRPPESAQTNHPTDMKQKNPDTEKTKVPLFRPPPGSFRPDRMFALFDRDRNFIAGDYIPGSSYLFRPINHNDETIGWIGLKNEKKAGHPLETGFLIAQRNAVFIMAALILFLAALISWLLSRHLLKPVQDLMRGTRAMSSFDFNTRIKVRTRDELGTLAESFNAMIRTLGDYEKMRIDWVSDISHELRTPVSILKGKIEAFQDGIRVISPKSLERLRIDILRLEKLVEDLHMLSLADSKNLCMIKQDVRPAEILASLLEMFQLEFEKHLISVHTIFNGLESLIINADPGHMDRLFSNIIENTVKYTDPPGKLSISLETKNNYAIIVVEDSAPGLTDEGLGLIFNRLYRGEKSRNRATGGSGLGLSICRQIVEKHDGSIVSAHSESGGLKLTIKLPINTNR